MEDQVPYKVYLYWDGEFSKPEVRRFGVEKGFIGNIKHLKAKLRDAYPKLKTKSYTIAWKDEDDDEILVSTDEEVATMISTSNEMTIKLYVRCTGPKKEADNDTEHAVAGGAAPSGDHQPITSSQTSGIQCNSCGCAVQGFRYKCVTCDDYDLCVRCETERKHPEHCVVRVPLLTMPLPLIKTSMKKSRKFLKSVASQSHEENKRLRREHRANKAMEAAASLSSQGKQEHTQHRPRRTWVEVFGKYMEEFANLAGDVSRNAERMAEAEAATAASTSQAGPTEPKSPTTEQISQNPWNLASEDLEKLQHACKYVKDHALRASARTINKVLEIAATVAEETVASSPPSTRAAAAESTAPEVKPRNKSMEDAIQIAKAAVKAAKEDAAKAAFDAAKNAQEAVRVAQEGIRSAQEGIQAATDVLTPQPSTSVAKTTETENGQSENLPKAGETIERPEEDTEEIFIVKRSLKRSNNSNASSSSESSDRAEEWTVINDPKDLTESDSGEAIGNCGLDFTCERLKTHPQIYPPLNTATAVLDPKEPALAASPAPSAPVAPQNETKPAQAKPAQAKPAQAKPAQAKPAQAKPAQVNPDPVDAPPTYTPLAPHIEAAVRQMEAMGFSNESGWLTQLLKSNDGNIATVVDLITPTNRE